VRALRVHQWAKNALILIPAVAAHLTPSPPVLLDLLTAVVSFSLLASSLYLLNDLVDLEHDRGHPVKRERPLAAGQVGAGAAAAVAAVCAVGSFLVALRLPLPFLATWGCYLLLSGTYSAALKKVVMLDVVVLAALYAVRVVAGAAALEVPLSRWFLAFAVFLFTALALLKRAVEVRGAARREASRLAGRGWEVSDLPVLLAFGGASSVAGALVYCLYITSDEVLALYARPDTLWLGLPVLLYWLGRVWLLALRGEVHEDPLLFALRDRASYLVLLVLAGLVWLAS
jgi:4-hydroxybenzoate polyprenyltransferase